MTRSGRMGVLIDLGDGGLGARRMMRRQDIAAALFPGVAFAWRTNRGEKPDFDAMMDESLRLADRMISESEASS